MLEVAAGPKQFPNQGDHAMGLIGAFRSRATFSGRSALPMIVLTALIGLSACGKSSTGPTDAVATVTVTPTGETILAGATLTLTATLLDADGKSLTGKTVTWSTSNAAVATVSAGVVTAHTPGGPVTITATSGGKSGVATVTVAPVPVAAVEIAPPSDTLEVGDTHQFTATTRSAAGATLTGRTTIWSSGDETVATVSTAGLVTAVGPGSASITAISEGISASMQVSVAGCRVVSNPSPAGTLTRDGTSYTFITRDGWRILINRSAVTIIGPDQPDVLQFWGDSDGLLAGSHENLNGKHIKDVFGNRRSVRLPSGALITMISSGERLPLHTVSIYEDGQSHTIDPRTMTLLHSCAGHVPTAVARDEAEADGETASFGYMENGGTIFQNEYRQDVSETGEPLEKVIDVQPLGSTGGPANPKQVHDLFDDPRLAHT